MYKYIEYIMYKAQTHCMSCDEYTKLKNENV